MILLQGKTGLGIMCRRWFLCTHTRALSCVNRWHAWLCGFPAFVSGFFIETALVGGVSTCGVRDIPELSCGSKDYRPNRQPTMCSDMIYEIH